MTKAKAVFTVEVPVTQKTINEAVTYLTDYFSDFDDSAMKSAKFNLTKFKSSIKNDSDFHEALRKSIQKYISQELMECYSSGMFEFVDDYYPSIQQAYDTLDEISHSQFEAEFKAGEITRAIELLSSNGFDVKEKE